MMPARPSAAFTLLEIMVALAIIALTLGAVIDKTTQSNRHAQHLRDKTIAGWVALNQLALVRARREWTNKSSKQGQVEMGGRDWLWTMKISSTDDKNIRRLDIDVFSTEEGREDSPLVSMTGFLGNL